MIRTSLISLYLGELRMAKIKWLKFYNQYFLGEQNEPSQILDECLMEYSCQYKKLLTGSWFFLIFSQNTIHRSSQLFPLSLLKMMRIIENNHVSLFQIILTIPEKKNNQNNQNNLKNEKWIIRINDMIWNKYNDNSMIRNN